MGRITLPVAETQILVDVILEAVAPCTIFVFGYTNITTLDISLLPNIAEKRTAKHHFDLLIFSVAYFANGASNVANAVVEKSGKLITASVLLHKVADLGTKQASKQWFFDQVLRNGQRIWLDKATVPYLLNHHPARDLATDTGFWHKCVAVAKFKFQSAKDFTQDSVVLCKIALLHSACSSKLSTGCGKLP